MNADAQELPRKEQRAQKRAGFFCGHKAHGGNITLPDFCSSSTSAKYAARIRRIFSTLSVRVFTSNASSNR
jgi:hypothetical protein